MNYKCFLDMDGILADFVEGISRAHGRPSPYTDERTLGISLGLFDMEQIWGITLKQFWDPSNSREFWATLAKTPEADAIVKLACDRFGESNVAVLTAPSMSEGCVPGKRDWIKRHYPFLTSRIIFGSAKEFLAGPDRILIDDRDKNVDAFNDAGGRGLLMPRLWNKDWPLADKALAEVKWRLENIFVSVPTRQLS